MPDRFMGLENRIHRRLIRHSVTSLRTALGVVFLGFGVLKYFPGVSPAQDLTEHTARLLFLGAVPDRPVLIGVATLECFIGLCLLSGRWMRLAIWLLAVELVGILSPLVLLPGRLFSGPHHAPTLEGQYVLKDVILVAAAMVIAAATFRGGRLIRDEPQRVPLALADSAETFDAARKLAVVLEGMRDDRSIPEVCETHGISETVYYWWRDQVLDGATRSLVEANGRYPPVESSGTAARGRARVT